MYIEHDGNIIFFGTNQTQYNDESKMISKTTFVEKCWFIAYRIKFMAIEKLRPFAHMWIQKKTLGVTYHDDIEKQLQEVIDIV